jgi:alkaline phosphatase D
MKSNVTINRRKFLERSVLGAGGVIFSTVLIGSCTDHNIPDPNDPNQSGSFDYNVASFDPTESQIILWTRVSPASASSQKMTLSYDIAMDAGFAQIITNTLA